MPKAVFQHRPERSRGAFAPVVRRLVLGASCALLLASCAPPAPHSALAQVRARGTLRVVTLNSPTSYYLGANGPQGFEFRLARAFAQRLGVKLEVEAVLDPAAMRAALLQNRADLAAAQISPDLAWRRIGLLTHSYGQIEQLVVQLRGRSHPRDVTELVGKRIVVRDASPQLAQLRDIQRRGVPGISWIAEPSTSSDLLAQLEAGHADYAIVDANEFAFTQHLYPDVNVAFALPDTRALQWVVRADGPDLLEAIDRYFAGAAESGELASIGREAQAESSRFDYDDAHRFRFDIATRLPQLQALFQQAAQMTGVDWRLIAAVGYQESKWEMEALSGNGARGIMMLTTEAADTVGVKNRDALSENILGGARYLAHVLATIPKHVPEPDRTWLALAAYNVGYGHLEDARVLTQKLGKNPDSWDDVRTQLPLLADAQWYLGLKRGYARGWEPAQFVQQVRGYLSVLEWLDASPVSMWPSQQVIRSALAAPVEPHHYD